jgi:putative protease
MEECRKGAKQDNDINRMKHFPQVKHGASLTPDLAFSRRSFPGWIGGVNHQELVDAQIQSHVGEFIGPVVQIGRDAIVVRIESDNSSAGNSQGDIIPGDGIAIINADGSRTGASVMQAGRDGEFLILKLRRGASLQSINEGSRVFRNHSVQFERQVRSLLNADLPAVPVDVTAVAQIGKPLIVTFTTGDGCCVTVQSDIPCVRAERSPLSEERLKEELGALSGTSYRLRMFRLHADEPVFLHQREWKKCRREAVEKLDLIRSAHMPISRVDVENALHRIRERSMATQNDPDARIHREGQEISEASSAKGATAARLHLLVRNPEHVILLNAGEVASVTLDFEYGRHLQKSLDILKEKGIRTGIATYRVMADGEDLKLIERHCPDVVLVRNAGALHRLKGYPGELIGDFSLNIANSISAEFFLNQAFLQRIVPSLDLNARELMQMIEKVNSHRIEIILHQRIPSFHMEYCLYAKYLSNGSDYRSCGIPCHSHRLSLRDPEGELHPVYTDFACRNTMYRSKPQSMAGYLQKLIKQGVQNYRIDLLDESKEAVRHLLDRYTSALEHPETGRSLIREEGWSEGQLRRNERSIKHRKEARR